MQRTIVITGVTSGFGLATARVFAQEGWNVVGTGRRQDRLDGLKNELGGRFLPLTLDMRDKDAVFAAFAGLPAPWSDVDVLVNNAGLALGLAPCQTADLDDWETMIDTNIKGVLYATRALLPGMVARDRGHIVNLGSTAGTYPYPGGNVYGGTKAFVKQFSLNLRTDLLGTAVRVTNIEPGLCETEFSEVRFKGDKARADSVYAGTNPILPADIAETIRWVTHLPAHVNINSLEVMPVCQSSGPLAVHKTQ